MSTTDTEDQQRDTTDSQTDGAEPSEQMDTPPTGDVDVADLSNRHYAGEKMEPILAGYWILIGEHKAVDKRYWGHLAAVIKSVVKRCDCDWSEDEHYHQDPRADLIVRTRDEYNSQITVPLAAVAEKAQDRATLYPFG